MLWITITTTLRRTLGPLFFASPNTDQQIGIAAYEVITPFLRAVAVQEHLKGFRSYGRRLRALPLPPASGLNRMASRFPGAVIVHDSTSLWTLPCGNICPGAWRRARGLEGFAHIKWGGMDGLDDYTDPALEEIGQSRLLFRSGTRCANPYCKRWRQKGSLEA